MFQFFEDIFDFSDGESSEETPGGSDEPTWEPFFDSWHDITIDVFGMLDDAAKDDASEDFVDAWHQATQDFADQYASWWGWNDGSPV
jgi:hypothetical protein